MPGSAAPPRCLPSTKRLEVSRYVLVRQVLCSTKQRTQHRRNPGCAPKSAGSKPWGIQLRTFSCAMRVVTQPVGCKKRPGTSDQRRSEEIGD